MKTLLHIVLYLPYGGLEKIVYDFSVALNGKDYEVHVAALQAGGPMQDKLEQAGIPVHVLGKRLMKIDCKLLVNLVKLIKKYDIDVIHSHSGCIMYAALAGRLAGVKKIIHTEHGKYFPEPKSRILEDRIFSHLITKYVCVSEELEKYVLTTTKLPQRKIVTIMNGVDTTRFYKYQAEEKKELCEKFGIPPGRVVLGTVCRLIPEKNVAFLVDWVKQYCHDYGKVTLAVVGEGPQYAMLRKKAMGIPEGCIEFLGARDDIPDFMNILDIFTLVSTTEGTSLTILEAMACQLPIVVSDVGGNMDIVEHNVNGMLFKCNNIDSFMACVNSILGDMKKGGCLGQRSLLTVREKFSFNNMLEQYKQLYSQ